MRLGRSLTLTLAAVLALPLALIGAPAARATTPEVDLLFEATAPWSYVNTWPMGQCDVPSDEPWVSHGTVVKVKATSTTPWLVNNVAAWHGKLVIPGGASQALSNYAYVSDTFDVGRDYVMAQVPAALNWNVDRASRTGTAGRTSRWAARATACRARST